MTLKILGIHSNLSPKPLQPFGVQLQAILTGRADFSERGRDL